MAEFSTPMVGTVETKIGGIGPMQGCITGRDVLRHPYVILRLWGVGCYLRCLLAVATRRRCTFLSVIASAADGRSYANKFSGKYSHRILDGIGHNVPREAPEAFAKAVVDADEYST